MWNLSLSCCEALWGCRHPIAAAGGSRVAPTHLSSSQAPSLACPCCQKSAVTVVWWKCHGGLMAMQNRASWSRKYCYLAKPAGLKFGAESFLLQDLLLLTLPSSSILMLTRCPEMVPCERVEHRRPWISTLYKA